MRSFLRYFPDIPVEHPVGMGLYSVPRVFSPHDSESVLRLFFVYN